MLANNYSTDDTTLHLRDSDLSTLTIDLCGVILPKPQGPATEPLGEAKKVEPLVLTETTAKNLHTIGLALSIGAPVLLEGVTGAGKTALVEEVARKVGRLDGKYKHLHSHPESVKNICIYIRLHLQNLSKFIWVTRPTRRCYWEPMSQPQHQAHSNGNQVYLQPLYEKDAGY